MHISVLGPIEVRRDDGPVDLGVRKQRALLAALVLAGGRAVSAGALVDQLWGDDAPPGALGTLQSYVSGLRRAVEPARESRSTGGVVATTDNGYVLDVAADALDAVTFERAVAAARLALGPAAHDLLTRAEPPDLERARRELAAARAAWRGTPYAELGDAPRAVAERARLTELRLVADELDAVVRLRDGDHAALAADLERATTEHPLRERLWALRVLALARAGRQADALAAARAVRGVLAEELGVDPGPELRQVEEAVLRQDPALAWRPAAPPARPAPAVAGAAWPLVGRDRELARLTALLDVGAPAFAALVGDPGIGKSRLAAELGRVAAGRGALVLTGRCSQDEGAPPLWPWTTVLGQLPGAPVDLTAGDDEPGDPQAGRFRTWDAVCRRVLDAAAGRPVLLVLDDLHWADPSSLRVLRHLVTTAESGRLTVVVTWRRHPGPTGPLAEVAEALARRHALRIELGGLGAGEAADLVSAVAGSEVSPDDRALLFRRTDGNPFFLVEYARLVQDTGSPVAEDELPAAVSDVLSRRLAGLPEATLTAVRAAAVLGREVPLPLLAAVLDEGEDAVLDALDPALTAGLVAEDGVDRFRFAHALVRDAAYGTLTLSRRARLHARAAAAWQDTGAGPQAAGETARHWLAAGPAAAARAWPAAAAAAEQALRVHAHEEARDLLRAALDAQAQDTTAGWRERYDVLMTLARACRLAADWEGLSAATDEAVAAAEAAGDVERAARAALGVTDGAVWQARSHGVVHEPAVAALRRALTGLPDGDGDLRCRAMLALASELYYSAAPQERRALVDEALAMARRIGEPALLQHALVTAFVATWWPSSAPSRLALVDEAADRARAAGDAPAEATAETLRAAVLGELGRIPEMWVAIRAARERATPLRMAYLMLVLDAMEAPWLAMSGRSEEADRVLDRLARLFEQTALPQGADGYSGALVTVRLYQGRLAEVLPMLGELVGRSKLPVAPVVAAMLLRLGLTDEARGPGPGDRRRGARDLVLDAGLVHGGRGGPAGGRPGTGGRRVRPGRPVLREAVRRRVRRAARTDRRLPRLRGGGRRGQGGGHGARRPGPRPVRGMADPAGRAVAARPAGPPRLLRVVYRWISRRTPGGAPGRTGRGSATRPP